MIDSQLDMDIIESIVESLKTEGLSHRTDEGLLFVGDTVIYDGDLYCPTP